ncbi:MAG TPA: IPT/TIG domain-containing protein [Anaerolineales bacterium]|nr:IPT/TIG domain-containing protein [Anaerolineales bacterium]HLO33391.1 IPT/TIG domain-containing protein [Anaerolineales bacterium]
MFDRPINRSLWTIAAIIVCIILVGVAAGVLALNRREQAVTLIKVPDDYATIQEAINAAEPADIIQVRAGTYNENLVLDKAVTLTVETFDQNNPANNTTIINGGAGTATITIPANLTQLPTIRGFVIQGGNNGIQASSPFIAEFNFFHSSVISVNYQWGAGGSNRNNVYFQSTDDAIHLDNSDRPLLIENNRIMYAGDDGIEVNLQDKPSPPAPVEIDIWNNMIIGSHEDGIQFVDFPGDPQDTNRRFLIVGNLIANSQKAGIGLMPNANTVEDFSGADTVEAIRVINNTFYGNNHGISGGDNLVAFNNIIANSAGRGVWKVQGQPGANAVVAYTLFFNNALDADQTTLGVGILTGQDPLFVAAPNPGPDGAWQTVDDDFSGLLLQGNSPAIDKGVAQYLAVNGEPIPPSPLTGFVGAAPDLGWREFGSPIVITPTASPLPSPTLPTPVPPSPTSTVTPVSPTATVPTLTSLPTVTAAPPSPTVPVPTATSTSPAPPTVAVTPTPQPTILNITPNTAPANTSVNLTITGSGFVNGSVVTFEGAQGTPPQVTKAQVVNPTTIVITVNTAVDASFGTQVWDLRVTNPGNSSGVLADAFTVTVTP